MKTDRLIVPRNYRNPNFIKISAREMIDVCVTLEEMVADGKLEGEIKGTVETCRKFNISLRDTVQRISDKFSLSLQQAEEEVTKY